MLGITNQEISDRLKFDNPWWEKGKIESRYLIFPKRSYFQPFYELAINLDINRAVILLGPRRVGKTVMAYQAVHKLIEDGIEPQKILYVSLETPIYTDLTLENILKLFIKEFEHSRDDILYIYFDEIQYLKDWEIHLKSLVDSFPTYKFIATGSAAAALRLKSRESGAGRFTEFLLPPLTFSEYLYFIEKEKEFINEEKQGDGTYKYEAKEISVLNSEFINYLNYGGYPEAVFSDAIQKDSARYIKSDIIDKVLLRDLPSLYGISDIQELNRLFTSIAYNTGNEVSLEALASSSGVAKNTLKRYLEYLEAAFLIKRVYRVDYCAKKFKRATKFKVYLTNPSMRAALFGPIKDGDDAMGALTETAIFSQWLHSETIEKLYYARWDSGEVDIVCISPSDQKPSWCVEVKWSDLIISDLKKIKSIINFSSKNNLKYILVTTKSKSDMRSVNGLDIEFTPSSEYAYRLSKNILRTKTFPKTH